MTKRTITRMTAGIATSLATIAALAPAAPAAGSMQAYGTAQPYGGAGIAQPAPQAEPEHAGPEAGAEIAQPAPQSEPEHAAAEPEHAGPEAGAEQEAQPAPLDAEPEYAAAKGAGVPDPRPPAAGGFEVAQQKDGSDDDSSEEDECAGADARHQVAMSLGALGQALLLSDEYEAAAPVLDAMEDLLNDGEDGCMTFSPDEVDSDQEQED